MMKDGEVLILKLYYWDNIKKQIRVGKSLIYDFYLSSKALLKNFLETLKFPHYFKTFLTDM